jgi:hypothetical protein
MRKKIKAWFKTLAFLMLVFGGVALLTHSISAALWLTGFSLILGLIGLVIT